MTCDMKTLWCSVHTEIYAGTRGDLVGVETYFDPKLNIFVLNCLLYCAQPFPLKQRAIYKTICSLTDVVEQILLEANVGSNT